VTALALIGESLLQAPAWIASAPARIVSPFAIPGVTVESLSLASAGLAFVAGLLSFLSPCVLPLLPVYLSFVSGMGVDELATGRRRLLGVSLLFVAGFTAVFVALGAGAGGVGALLTDYRRELEVIAGAFVAVSGLAVAGLISLPERGVGLSPRLRGPAGAVLTGAALAVAWTPCVGYVLGAILSMAASSQSAFDGALLLLMYSLGLGVPFVAAALAFGWVSARLDVVKRHYATVRVVAGAIMVVAGLLMMLGVFSRLSGWLPAFDLGGF
jgi:cytochrome c-type biogenesis protein